MERRLTLDDQALSAKGTNADKPAMKTSSAASTGSRTSSRAELLTSPKDCLYHADGDRVAELAMAPINSTGDIYHIIAYLFLAECCIPNVTLMHDSTNDAKKCNDLCHKFTECFKFPHGTIKVQEIEQNGCHQNPRQDAARKFFPAGTIYIDQKACTTYIAHECYRQGRDNVTATLREKFSQYNCEKKDAIKKYAEC